MRMFSLLVGFFGLILIVSACSKSSSTIDQNKAVTASFASIYAGILSPGCSGCHGGSGGYSFDSYNNTILAVVKGNAASSPLYTSLSAGRMPKDGTAPSASQLAAIQTWINAGALNN